MKTVVLFCAALLLAACAGKAPESKESKEPVKKYVMRGEVMSLDPEHQAASIKHEDIEGFMHAMTMDYGFRDKKDFAKLHKGDHFTATLFSQGDDYWVGEVKPGPERK
jgi:Cu/Ag efflux protein CusF